VFLSGRGVDAAGRRIDEILAFDDATLEAVHDYIQWLFPLPEPSRAVPGSPVLDAAGIEMIRTDPDACRNLDRAAAMMLGFYGRTTHWLVLRDHNHLRITRIVRSLRLLRGPDRATAFLAAILAMVDRAGGPISRETLGFWRAA
jgi:hypothetical protein